MINNKPKYLLVDLANSRYLELTEDEKIEMIAFEVASGKMKYEEVLSFLNRKRN